MRVWLKTALLISTLVLSGIVCGGGAYDFTEAKKIARVIWSEHRETFYCGCPYDRQGVVNYKKCDYQPKDKLKSKRISWEHVVPASWYGKTLSCWSQKQCITQYGKAFSGRECCRLIDPNFRKMEADLHNLVPAIREVNTLRKNYHFAELPYLHQKCPKNKDSCCHFYLDEKKSLVEPRDDVKGMVARIQLYMAKKYHIKLPKSEYAMLVGWSKKYPPQQWEQRWHHQVSAIQGDTNPYIQYYNKQLSEVNA